MKQPKEKSIKAYLQDLKKKGYKIPDCSTCKIKKKNKNACKNCDYNILLNYKSDLQDSKSYIIYTSKKRKEEKQMAITLSRGQRFIVDNENETIIAKMESLTDKDVKILKNYKLLGYNVIPYEKPKAEETEEKIYTEPNVRKFLEEKGTKEQQKKFEKLYNEKRTGANNKYKADSYKKETYIGEDGKTHSRTVKDEKGEKIIVHKKGEIKVKGFINTLRWFKEEFQNEFIEYINENK